MVAGTFLTVSAGLYFFQRFVGARNEPPLGAELMCEAKEIEAQCASLETEGDDCGTELLDFIAVQKLMQEHGIKELESEEDMPSKRDLQKIKDLVRHLGRYNQTEQESLKERRLFVKMKMAGSNSQHRRPSHEVLNEYARMCQAQKDTLDQIKRENVSKISFALYRTLNEDFELELQEVDDKYMRKIIDDTLIPEGFDEGSAQSLIKLINGEAKRLKSEFEEALKVTPRGDETRFEPESERLQQLATNFARDWILEKHGLSEK